MAVTGIELTLRNGLATASNVGYFTVRLSGNTLNWTMPFAAPPIQTGSHQP
ncbi:hypothetical protein [Fibrella aquatilis]|uniref:Uncharacterized protein n=1 Tax=Fibrella aquatilis TaxID=2817059 RepID=A0A939GBU9_9BACT|nr:hypothetical protein [Fibrella aquatilis]MBO0933816.1 hypothetical protein [Fibrella aquatilis]